MPPNWKSWINQSILLLWQCFPISLKTPQTSSEKYGYNTTWNQIFGIKEYFHCYPSIMFSVNWFNCQICQSVFLKAQDFLIFFYLGMQDIEARHKQTSSTESCNTQKNDRIENLPPFSQRPQLTPSRQPIAKWRLLSCFVHRAKVLGSLSYRNKCTRKYSHLIR